jgi:Arc/MetJ-type ribon-helix-helix transcriptional regulator
MKLSISVPDEQMALIDRVMTAQGLTSRSAAIQQGIELWLNQALVDDYAAAFKEWDRSGDSTAWETVVGDGLEADDGQWW